MAQVDFSTLFPQPVWQNFQTLCTIPRPSKHEQQLRTYLKNWAEQRNLWTYVDRSGNLIIRKAATVGMENAIPVILQGHLDMVTQANRNTVHDFMKDPIIPIIKDGWLIAENTTLGADNGIGVALALAVLDADDIQHGPIEVLLTVDEEAGMSGARGLQPDILQGQWLFNIDTEEWGKLYLGCAGSQDVEIQQKTDYVDITSLDIKQPLKCVNIQVSGLKGGHSGVDIHLGRGNANVILAGFLAEYLQAANGHLIRFSGGSARNALPREAIAQTLIPAQQLEAFAQQLKQYEQAWLQQLQGIDDGLQLSLNIEDNTLTEKVLEPAQQHAWLTALATCPYGVYQMSKNLADVVETSNNIGVVDISSAGAKALIMVRSLINTETQNLAQQIASHFSEYDISARLAPFVSGWTPNPNSAALKCLQQAYQQTFNIEPQLKVIHAGLECGIIAEHYPNLQMVSFGPDIRGAHAPGERVNIETVGQCWQLLKTALALAK